jgi:hypothetical protein
VYALNVGGRKVTNPGHDEERKDRVNIFSPRGGNWSALANRVRQDLHMDCLSITLCAMTSFQVRISTSTGAISYHLPSEDLNRSAGLFLQDKPCFTTRISATTQIEPSFSVVASSIWPASYYTPGPNITSSRSRNRGWGAIIMVVCALSWHSSFPVEAVGLSPISICSSW